jgi:hypothetical protein
MPALTRWFIKSALAYFIAALLLGVALPMPAVFALLCVPKTHSH